MLLSLRTIAVLISALWLMGCTTVGDPWHMTVDVQASDINSQKTQLSFSVDILPILEARSCTAGGCHNGEDLSMGLDASTIEGLTSPTWSTQITVVPCEPDAGTLLDKMSTTPSFGVQMPIGADPVTTDEMTLIRQWILEGATETWNPDSCL